MKIYQYNRHTGAYIGVSQADEDPMRPGNFLIPAFATTITPPTPGANQIPVFKDGSWSLVTDLRNTYGYKRNTGEKILVTEIGDLSLMGLVAIAPDFPDYPSAWSDSESGWVVNMPTAKNLVLKKIDEYIRGKIISGFSSAATGSACTYDSQDNDQDNIKLMQMTVHLPSFATSAFAATGIPIRAIPVGATEKTVLWHTPAQMDTLLGDMSLHVGTCKQRGWELQSQVAAANNGSDLLLVEKSMQ